MKPAATAEGTWEILRLQMLKWTGIMLGPRDADSALRTVGELLRGRTERAVDYLLALDGESRATERQHLIDRLVIGATWFMREAAGIHALVAALLRDGGPGRPVHVWSAGCSTGQEPYSLAMALVEAGLRPRILATDINHESLRIAAAATYPLRSLAALPAAWQNRYVSRRGAEQGRILPAISSLVTFALHNLATPARPQLVDEWGPLDAVVCRNVLLYFERSRATDVVRRLARCCRPGGYVLLSAAERPLVWMTESLEEIDKHYDVVLLRSAATAGSKRAPEERKAPKPPVIAAPGVPPPGPANAKKTLAEVMRLMESAELGRALQLLDGLVQAEPLLGEAHLLRGLALKRRGALAEAAVALRCARFLFSDEAWLPPYHLALVLEQLGEIEEACEAYRHARAVVAAGSRSGLATQDGDEEALALTVAEACAARLRALRPLDHSDRPGR